MATDEKLYSIINNPQQLTCEQVEDLLNDSQLSEDCKALLVARRQLCQSRSHVDAEEALQQFKRRHVALPLSASTIDGADSGVADGEVPHMMRRRMVRMVVGLVAVAAMVIGFLFLLKPKPVDLRAVCETPVADSVVRITDANGEDLPLAKSRPVITATARQVVVDATHLDNTTQAASITIPYGKEAVVCLPDNSKVYLHPGSRLVFPCQFADNIREVHLEGEAYFVVAHHAETPFVVVTKRSATRVYGTEFDVTSRPEKPESVTLVTGKVAVGAPDCMDADGNMKENAVHPWHHITPGTQAVITAHSVSVKAIDTEVYTMWRDGYLYFDNTPLSDILRTLSEYYNVTIKNHNEGIKELRMRFFVRRTDTIEDVVESLNSMQQVKVSLKGAELVIF